MSEEIKLKMRTPEEQTVYFGQMILEKDKEIDALKAKLTETEIDRDRWHGNWRDSLDKWIDDTLKLKADLTEARKERDEAREEIKDFESLLELQRSRMKIADKLWQDAHNKPDTLPDLGDLIQWLMDRTERLVAVTKCGQQAAYLDHIDDLQEKLSSREKEVERAKILIDKYGFHLNNGRACARHCLCGYEDDKKKAFLDESDPEDDEWMNMPLGKPEEKKP